MGASGQMNTPVLFLRKQTCTFDVDVMGSMEPGNRQRCAAGAVPVLGLRRGAPWSLNESEPLNLLGLGNPNGVIRLGS